MPYDRLRMQWPEPLTRKSDGAMNPEVFTERWAHAWCHELNASEVYRTAAATWEGAVGLMMRADPLLGIAEARAVVLDLWHGKCRGYRVSDASDLADVAYLVEAAPADWREVLSGRASPILSLMSGRLRLTQRNLAALLPYANAAKELVTTAATVHARFPEPAV
jgi:putative sterol carrier protein